MQILGQFIPHAVDKAWHLNLRDVDWLRRKGDLLKWLWRTGEYRFGHVTISEAWIEFDLLFG